MREEIATLFFDEVPPVTSKQVSIPCQKYHINMVDVNLIDLAGIASRSEELMKGGVGYCNLVIWIGFVTHAGGTQVSAARLFYPQEPSAVRGGHDHGDLSGHGVHSGHGKEQ